jgi:hypothetical protein
MPSPSDILEGLAAIVRNFGFIAILWHIIFAAMIVLLIAGWRPSRKLAATALSIPLFSVAIFAWLHNNPFNGIVFLIFAVLLMIVGLRLPDTKIQKAPPWALVIGLFMIAFGWVYPHFLEFGRWYEYLYAAPMGLIPCPTLSITIGFALLAKGLSSRAWSILLAGIGLFYGLSGAFRLGVRIDVALFFGALTLFILAFTQKPDVSPEHP